MLKKPNIFIDGNLNYSRYRPTYPKQLYSFLLEIAGDGLVWDCACGSGQATKNLSEFFSGIIATDISAEQLSMCPKDSGIEWRVAAAEKSGLDSRSISLICVAEALHWFDLDLFYREVDRVLIRGGYLAAWGYCLSPNIALQVDDIVNYFEGSILADYWLPEYKIVQKHYREIPFPFQEIDCPQFTMKANWNAYEMLGYMNTWSAAKVFEKKNKTLPTAAIEAEFLSAWGDPGEKKSISWPLFVRIAQKY